ncbi:MAG: general secretion pathway protein A [Polaribacter sp.]|jgi:general secretion pathway protein A|tara:strand:- start:737 stop:2497 length:1761 start_codon:yes stop_codon:yes gene_type:complete
MSIYLQHFGLKREPFSIVPDPGFLYPSHQHRQAVAHLKYGLDREGGFILLTGEVGTGKTTLTRTMLQRIPAHVRVAYVLNSKLNESDLLASICSELSIKIPTRKHISFSKTCIDVLNQDLLEAHAAGKKTLIVIEEAQNLSHDVLETLRLLSNLETNTHKLLHILLVGQPELLEILGQNKLRQLNQRVVSRFHLLPLDKTEIANYINHRLHHAGAGGAIFDTNCVDTLFKLTKGVPRLINLICHQALLAAYSTGAKTVSAKLVKLSSKEILVDLNPTNGRLRLAAAVLASVVFIALAATLTPLKNINWNDYLTRFNSYSDGPSSVSLDTTATKDPVVAPTVSQEIVNTGLVDIEQLPPDDQFIESVLSGSSEASIQMDEKNRNWQENAESRSKNPLINLLNLWNVPASDIYTLDEFDALAERSGLRSVQVDTATLSALSLIDRPGIVFMQQTSGLEKSHLVLHIGEFTIRLISSGEIIVMDRSAFLDQWTASYLYLWRSPDSFEMLKPGDFNKPALAWLQGKLGLVNDGLEQLITGGNYSVAIQAQVTDFQRQQNIIADGIVGRQTLMRLNQLTDPLVPRLTGSGG